MDSLEMKRKQTCSDRIKIIEKVEGISRANIYGELLTKFGTT